MLNQPSCPEDLNIFDISSLKNDKFWINIHGAPDELAWSVTGLYVPGMSVGNEQIFVKDFALNTSGDTLTYEQAVIEFKISNNLKNYLYFVLWMQNLIKNDVENKDIAVSITDSNNIPKRLGFKLKSVFPTSLSGIKYTIEEDTLDLRATVTFAMDLWTIVMDGEDVTDNYEYVLGKTESCSVSELKEGLISELLKK